MIEKINRILTKRTTWPAVLIFLLALLPRVTTLGGTFIVNDEPLYWKWTNQFATALLTGDWRGTMIGIGYPAITVTWVHTLGIGAETVLRWLAGASPTQLWQQAALDQPFVFNMMAQRRVVMGLTNALVILLIYYQARPLLGRTIAFLGAALMSLSPFLLADARTMRGDALLSGLMLLSALLLLNYLRRPRWWQMTLSGVAFGLALLTKMTALPLTGFMGLAVLAHALYHPELRWLVRLRRGIITLAVTGLATAATVVALWPALWVAPLTVLEFMGGYAASSIDGRLNFFWGHLTTGQQILLFYPNAFLFRATPLVLLGVVVVTGLALAGGWRWLRRKTDHPLNLERLWQMPSTARLTVLALSLYAVIYGLVLTYGALKRDRYLMPVFPAVMFVAAAGLLWLTRRVARRWPGKNLPSPLSHGRWAWGALGLLLALQLSHVLSTHPYYYTYWSPVMGGGRVAMNVMMAEGGIDSTAIVKLNRRPNAKNETLALLTSRDYEPAYVGKVVRLTNGSPWITADHILVRQYHYQTQKMDPDLVAYLKRKPPEIVDQYQGYIWSWVYPGPAAQFYAGSMLDGKAELLGYNLSGQTASTGQPLRVKLFWQNQGTRPSEYIYVRLVDAGGFVWAEARVTPLPDFEPTAYQPQTIVEGNAVLEIPPGTPPGLYFLKMGIATTEPGEPDIGQFVLPDAGNTLVVEKPVHPPESPLGLPLNQPFGRELTLLGAESLPQHVLTPQTPQPLTLFWQAQVDVKADYTVEIRLLDESGRETARWSGSPGRGIYPTPNWPQGAVIRDPWILDLTQADAPPLMIEAGRHRLVVSLLNAGTVVGQATLGDIDVSDRRRLFEPPAIDNPLDAKLGDRIGLLGYNLEQAPLTGGVRFILKLFWQARQPIPQDYTVFVQVLGPDGTVVGQHDGVPANGSLPTTRWESGEIVPDRHRIDFPALEPGDYRLIVGMYRPATGERLPIIGADGAPLGDFIQLYNLSVKPPGE